jgi:hypothetical protein
LFSLCGGLVMSVLLPSTYPFAVALWVVVVLDMRMWVILFFVA